MLMTVQAASATSTSLRKKPERRVRFPEFFGVSVDGDTAAYIREEAERENNHRSCIIRELLKEAIASRFRAEISGDVS